MRLFGLSCPLPHPVCRPLAYRNSSAMAGADVVLWSPAGSIAEYQEMYERPGAGGAEGAAPLLTLAGTEAFLGDERRRRNALNGLLREGGIVVVDLAGAARLRIHTVEQIFEVDPVAGFPHPGASVTELLNAPATSTQIPAGEPFRAFARAVLDGTTATHGLVRHPGDPLVRTRTGDVLGFYAGIGAGYLVALPIGARSAGPGKVDDLVRAIGDLAGAIGRVRHGILPPWVDDDLTPEETVLRDEAAEIEHEVERLQRRGRAVALERERLRIRRELIFARGRMLEEAVSDAFRSSRASVIQGRDGESDLVVERAGTIHVVDIHVDTRDGHADRIARIADIAAREGARAGATARAILIDASEQSTPPAERARPPFSDAVLEAARTRQVTLLTTLELLTLARRAPDLPGDPWAAWLGSAPRPANPPEDGWPG